MDLVVYMRSCLVGFLARFGRTERGASMVEYAFLLALVAMVCIVAVAFLGGKTSAKFNAVGASLS